MCIKDLSYLHIFNYLVYLIQSTLRPMCVMAPDYTQIGEALLLSYGFTEARALSLRLSKVLDNLKCQV